jgi:hypothetical protein
MREYWQANTLVPKGWDRMDATALQAHFRQKISAFHNAVNERLGKPVVPLSPTPVPYCEAVGIVAAEWEIVRRMWDELAPLIPAYFEWRTHMARLIQLIRCEA